MIFYNLRFELFLMFIAISISFSQEKHIYHFYQILFRITTTEYIWNWIDYYATLNLRRLENKWIEEESKIV